MSRLPPRDVTRRLLQKVGLDYAYRRFDIFILLLTYVWGVFKEVPKYHLRDLDGLFTFFPGLISRQHSTFKGRISSRIRDPSLIILLLNSHLLNSHLLIHEFLPLVREFKEIHAFFGFLVSPHRLINGHG